MTETIREFLNKHNLNVERVTWTHIGNDKKFDDPVILYDKNNLIPDILYVPARGNGKVLTTIRLLLKQLSKEPKPISPYKYKNAILKNVKYELTKSEWDKVVVKVQSEWCKNDALVDYIAGKSSFAKAIKEYQDRLCREVSHEAYKVALETGLPYNEAFDMVVKEISERVANGLRN